MITEVPATIEIKNLVVFTVLVRDQLLCDLANGESLSANDIAFLIEQAEKNGFRGNILEEYILHLMVVETNIFAEMAENNNAFVGKSLLRVAKRDILLIRRFIEWLKLKNANNLVINNYIPTRIHLNKKRADFKKIVLNGIDIQELVLFYSKYAYGIMFGNYAFTWDSEIGLIPVKNYDVADFESIIGYERQKEQLIENTNFFLADLPANNVLLYGERGTGKSSSIKALLNYFQGTKLRLVEVNRNNFHTLPKLINMLSKWQRKFIIVLDDLSFESFEVEYKYLKSVLEGGLEIRPKNVLIYATSNRRNIINEEWQPGIEEMHRIDSENEKISLSDRFGLKIFYISPGQEEYLNIIDGLLNMIGLEIPTAYWQAEAIKWEMSHSGRSGRVARQFVDYLISKDGQP